MHTLLIGFREDGLTTSPFVVRESLEKISLTTFSLLKQLRKAVVGDWTYGGRPLLFFCFINWLLFLSPKMICNVETVGIGVEKIVFKHS